MQKYYTAVGRFERKGRMGDMTCPMVIINNREYALDIQEMILWAALNWQIMDAGALEDAYSAKLKASGIRPQRSISDCMRRLMQRGLWWRAAAKPMRMHCMLCCQGFTWCRSQTVCCCG